MKRKQAIGGPGIVLAAVMLIATVAYFSVRERPRDAPPTGASMVAQGAVMLILRGVAGAQAPRGQLDDASALEYARRLGYAGEVLDVAGEAGAQSPQARMALERIRHDDTVAALYGFSGGGYNARFVWNQLSEEERRRIRKVIVIGSPGVREADFPESADVIVKPDPPEGHLAGPKALLDELDNTVGRGRS